MMWAHTTNMHCHIYSHIHISCKLHQSTEFQLIQHAKRTSNHLFTGEGAAVQGVPVTCYMKVTPWILSEKVWCFFFNPNNPFKKNPTENTMYNLLWRISWEIKRRWKWTRRKPPIWNLPRYQGSLWGIDMHIELMSPCMLWWSSRVSSCQNRGIEWGD
jgi:hypothetical protein